MSKTIYPYVVVRLMSGVYCRCRVVFVSTKAEESRPRMPSINNDDKGGKYFAVYCDEPFINGKLTLQARDSLVMLLHEVRVTINFRMCVVFGRKDAVYVDSGGQTIISSEPP